MSQTPIIEYFKPLRAVVTIRDKTGDPTLLFHDSFHPPEPDSGSPAIYYIDVDLAYGQAGTFTLRINDQEHTLDTIKIGLGNQVWIQAGRDEDKLFTLFSGVCRSIKPIRQDYSLLGYEMSGFGTQIIFNERVVNYLRTAIRRTDNPSAPFIEDPNMKANKLFDVLMTANDVIPLGLPAIKHTLRPGMFNTEEQIDPRVDTFIASLTEPYVEASQVANSIADMAGAIWGISPRAPGIPDRVFLRFPSTTHSGTIIKDRPDDPLEYTSKNVSYLRAGVGGFSYTDSMRKEDGFTNRIFSKTGADVASGSTSSGAENFTRLAGIDIAQQFTVNSTRLRDLSFTMGVEGRGEVILTAPWEPLLFQFRVCNDAGNRPGPVTEIFGNFPIDWNNGEVKQVFLKLPDNFTFKTLTPGQKAWIIQFNNCGFIQRGGSLGCMEPQPEFSVHWYHDGGTTGISAIRTICDPPGTNNRTPGFNDTANGWVVNTAGPTYSHAFFDSFSHIIEASDQESIDKYGEVDSFIDATFLTDENSMNQYLSSILQFSAKPRRIYEMQEIFIPYNSLIEPGSLVTVIDSTSGHTAGRNITSEVQEVRYEFSADASGRTPLGTNTCEVRLLGYVDFREAHVLEIAAQNIELPIPIINPPPPPSPPPPPPPGPVIDLNVLAVGDIGGESGEVNTFAAAVNSDNPDLVALIGDYSYEERSPSSWVSAALGSNLGKTRAAFGNHESDNTSAWGSAFGNNSSQNNWNYTYVQNDVFFLVINTDSPPSNSFISQALSNANIAGHRWKIVVMHKFIYGSHTGSHSPDGDLGKRDAWVPIFDQYHVDLVLQGHNHIYDRSKGIKFGSGGDNPTITDNPTNGGTTYSNPIGTVYIVVGTGGQGNYSFSGGAPSYSQFRSTSYEGFLRLAITNESIQGTFKRYDSNTSPDTFTITKGGAGGPPPPSPPLSAPYLCAFYYPWYSGASDGWRHWNEATHNPPTTWASNTMPDINPSAFEPATGLYNSKDPTIIANHITRMQNIGVTVGISSWWGQGTYEDQAFELILNSPSNTRMKWCIYYEDEGFADPSVSQIVSDLNYIKNRYAANPNYFKIAGKPVVFVYAAAHSGSDPMNDLSRWEDARAQTGFYVNMKRDALSAGASSNRMDSWHEYAPASRFGTTQNFAAFVSPSFHKYHESVRLTRNLSEFDNACSQLKNANVTFKLIQTWNEWNESTTVEAGRPINHNDGGSFTSAGSSWGDSYTNAISKYFAPLTPPPPPPGPGPSPPPPPPPPPGQFVDSDGVRIIYPLNNTPGKFHHNLVEHIGSGTTSFGGDDILEMDIEGNAIKTTSGGVTYWRCISREGSFASGGTNWTSRPEWVSNHCNTPAGVSGAKSRGYLCNANDPKSVEATIIFKVDGIQDNSEEATMGIRGDDHSDTNEKCLQQKNFFPYGSRTSNLWGYEKTHPDSMRRAVTFVSPYTSSNQPVVGENVWRGMKLIAWNINNNQAIHCEMWIDENPINPSGGYNNNWKKVWIYEEQRTDTPTWGGPRQQFRVDMCEELHLAAFNFHEIIPPGNPTTPDLTTTDARSQTATAETLAEKAEYEETTGLTHPDYIAEMVPVTGTDIATTTGEIVTEGELSAENAGLRPQGELPLTISEETGKQLRPKIIIKESQPIVAERDEIDATFGE